MSLDFFSFIMHNSKYANEKDILKTQTGNSSSMSFGLDDECSVVKTLIMTASMLWS